ncbi:elongation factor P hydroxylase [Aliamphritea ceti]|uniref:elongation factor P hydroxylase n=1 Tax=Aliamphritea ceti TaxID=1524258 RepID=UPI0021C40A82|nr:elongation factor P hydroxylase [Aliamphritea ceti]
MIMMLVELSHWCVAGPNRWHLEDFGYWYKPDGRSAAEQAEFERVEIKPQAFEWLFSHAAGRRFHFSADNLASDIGASESFKQNVVAQVQQFLSDGLPSRPALLIAALQEEFATEHLQAEEFTLD